MATMSPLLPLILAAATGVSAVGASAAPDPLAQYRWSKRVVVALAASADDRDFVAQRLIFSRLGRDGAERDLVLVAETDATPAGRALRQRFGGGPGFLAVLVGKDGGDKLSSTRPLDAATLFSVVDAMPMRRQEMRSTP